jgi:hypothetical protein
MRPLATSAICGLEAMQTGSPGPCSTPAVHSNPKLRRATVEITKLS